MEENRSFAANHAIQNTNRIIDFEDGFEISKKCEDLFSKDFTTKQTRFLNSSPRVMAIPNANDLCVGSPIFTNSICSDDTQETIDSSNDESTDMSLFQETAQHVATFAEDLFAQQSQEFQHTIETFSQSSQRHEEALDRITNNLEQLTRLLRERRQRRE